MTASMPPVAPIGNVCAANPQIFDDSSAEYAAEAELSVRESKLATTLPSPRLYHPALRSILHPPSMFEDLPDDPPDRVARRPAVGHDR
jgi:hypothetical protein